MKLIYRIRYFFTGKSPMVRSLSILKLIMSKEYGDYPFKKPICIHYDYKFLRIIALMKKENETIS